MGVVVDSDSSYLVEFILRNRKFVVALTLISLSRPVSIGHDEVKIFSFTFLLGVFKASDGMKHSTPLLNHGSSRKDEESCTLRVDAYWL